MRIIFLLIIVNLADGHLDGEAVNGRQLDNYLKVNGTDQMNGNLYMNGNKIKNLDDGSDDSDAVNLGQLKKLGYYYFTDQLKHDNSNTVKFPRSKFSPIDSYPFSRGSDQYKLRIRIDGYYHIIYTDFYKKKVVNL